MSNNQDHLAAKPNGVVNPESSTAESVQSGSSHSATDKAVNSGSLIDKAKEVAQDAKQGQYGSAVQSAIGGTEKSGSSSSGSSIEERTAGNAKNDSTPAAY